jgi:hypothetical protein
MDSHGAVVVAVQVPVPEVRMDPPPPSFVKERVGGSMVTCAQTAEDKSQVNESVCRVGSNLIIYKFIN